MIGQTEFLDKYAPKFCWMTAKDLFIMYEQINENIEEMNFYITLSRLKKKGWFHVKPWSHPTKMRTGKPPSLYLRIT